jgi:hypothetical protein
MIQSFQVVVHTAFIKRTVLTALIATLPTGCFVGGEEQPVMGRWQSVDTVDTHPNTVFIDDDLFGSATIYYYLDDDPTLYYTEYLVVATAVERDRSYDLEMICDEDFECSSLDFTMSCRVIDGTNMSCSCDEGMFAHYPFLDFERPGD